VGFSSQMDIHQLRVHDLLALNKATAGQLHQVLAAAWNTFDASDVDLQVTFDRGTYTIHITGLVGDAVVCEQAIHVRGDRTLGEATKATLLILWIDTIQARTRRAVARADAAAVGWSASRT
jgi:hypothetical protein